MAPPARFALACLAFAHAICAAQPEADDSRVPVASISDLSLEQLSNIVVTSIGKRAQRLADVAASVYVIRGDDIRRAGVTSIPEALRLAPNLQVARADSTQYAISARNNADLLANKMLVLVDGRTVYSPLFSGVFWEALDTLLADIDRIEVLSGAGGTLYGSNAFNGVINIITKPASETTGFAAAVGAGRERRYASARYGASDEQLSWRVWAKRRDISRFESVAGATLPDASRRAQAGFRVDGVHGAVQSTLQGDIFQQHIEDALGHRDYSGANLLGRLVREGGSVREQLQVYLDEARRDRSSVVKDVMDTVDAEYQRQSQPLEGHELLWGAGWRLHHDRGFNYNPAMVALVPPERYLHLWNVFVQDEVAVAPRLKVTLGLKAERNDYTGLEWLPTLRAAWSPAPEHLLWAGISRVVRTPSRVDREVSAPQLQVTDNFQSEVARVTELGYRGQPWPRADASITVFHHALRRLRSLDFTPGIGGTFNNNYSGSLVGVEGWGEWRPTERWRLRGGFLVQHADYHAAPGTAPLLPPSSLGNDVSRQAMLGSLSELGPRSELDIELRHVASRPNPAVPTYTALDIRWGWRPRADIELALVGRNLNHPWHLEWATATDRVRIPRSVILQAVFRR